jgi:hypothetical protein
VDQDGEVVEVFLRERRDGRAPLRLGNKQLLREDGDADLRRDLQVNLPVPAIVS